MIRIDDLTVFVQSVDAGSFSAAARDLGITPALASSAVQRLEGELGRRLFIRSTRSLRLSSEGAAFLPHARSMLEALDAGRRELQRDREAIDGLLRLSIPSDLGRNALLGWLDAFQARHPKLRMRLDVSDRSADLYRQPLDLAIRYGVPADSSLVVQPLAADNRRLLCASPAYLERHGMPATPEDLLRHNCLCYVWADKVLDRWSFEHPGGARQVIVAGDRVSDDADVVRRWAVAGHGVLYKSALDLAPDVAAGRLLPLLPAFPGEPAPLNLICAHRSVLVPAVTMLRDFLRQCCAEQARDAAR